MSAAAAASNPLPLEMELVPFVKAAARADGSAFRRLVDAAKGSVTAITLAISRDVAASEDIAQDVFLTAWRRLPELENPASFLPWVRQIARLTARTWVRDGRTRARLIAGPGDLESGDLETQGAAESSVERAADPALGPEGALLGREREAILAQALEAMPDESREVMVLFYREGRSTRQVASLLGLSEAAVRKRLQRARAGLRAEMLERFAELARKSAPGAAFTASVLAATASAPTAAAAALAGASGHAGWVQKLLILGGGAAVGWLGGAAGVVLGLRRDLEAARSEAERHQLKRLRASALLAVTVGCLGFMAPPLRAHWLGPVAVYLTFLATMATIYLGWLPKILEGRFVAEEDGCAEAVAQRLEIRRRRALFGLVLGGVSGGAGLLAGLLASGLLTL
ncbi:MAG: sigma-70 family RNA polymerase sigma factor [Acidobacteriota bacterium]